MIFLDRLEAGKLLAEKLKKYAHAGAVVLALPRGGVVLGRAVADALDAPLDIVVPRKIGAPSNEEYAIGAVTETGEAVWNEEEKAAAGEAYCEKAAAEQRQEAQRRLKLYRQGRPARAISGKTVIIVDDGIATGLTMRAAIRTVRGERPARIVVAVPVAPADTVERMSGEADELIALQVPDVFYAIGAFYQEFDQVDDQMVIALMSEK